jgi:predicted DCC family thiol-disulfide oxidoreductase YuxK
MARPEFTILIDGDCPLCRREADLMRRLDRGRGRLALVDIAAPGFDPAAYGTTMDAVMGTIHGVVGSGDRPGGLVTGMEVFRRAYRAVGWGWVLAPTGWPLLRPVFDRVYRWFARNRLRLTGRPAACTPGQPGQAPRCRV